MPENPYEPTTNGIENEFRPPSSSSRPVSVKVFGVLNLVFAVMGMCGLAFSSVALFIPQNPQFPNPALEVISNNAGYRIFMIASMAFSFIFNVVLVFGGVGLLQYRRYGRSASIVYGWYAIVSAIVGAVANYFFLAVPLLQQAAQQGQGQPAAIGGAIGAVGGVIGPLFEMIYPTILLIFMYRRNVIDSLR